MLDRPRTIIYALATFAFTFLIVACGTTGGGGGGGGGGESNDVGVMSVTESTEQGQALRTAQTSTVTAGGAFLSFDADLPANFADNPYQQVLDTCTVTTLDDVFDPGGAIPFPSDFTTLDAGDAITIEASGEAGAYLTLDRTAGTIDGTTFITYGTSAETAGSLPAGLTANAPGNEFPNVDGAQFPTVDALELAGPPNPASIGVDTAFQWTGSGASTDTVVMISVNSAFDFTDPFDLTFVNCIATDDGSFTFPADTKTALGGDFSGTLDSLGRVGYEVYAIGDASLVLSVERMLTFPLQFATGEIDVATVR